MLRSFLIGLVAGARSMTPLAAVSLAARFDRLPTGRGFHPLLGSTPAAGGATALAAGELAGDKLPSAPDRIVPAGMLARLATGAIAGAALAPRGRTVAGAVTGAAAATAAAYVSFDLRMPALRRFGQTPSGLVEDALCLGAAALIVLWPEER